MPVATHRPLSDRARLKLLRLARAGSEGFARATMAAAVALDEQDDAGIEFVDSLNGIDVYDASEPHSGAATRLRSFCHVDADIVDVVRRLTASGSPGIVEAHELCSVLPAGSNERPHEQQDKEFPERAGVNWVVLGRDPTRESRVSSGRDRTSSLSSSFSPNRQSSGDDLAIEFVVLAYQGVFQHRGRRGWVQWCQSIELSNFPTRPGDPTRGVMFSSGIVAVESATRPGHVSVGYALGLDLSQHDDRERRFLEAAVWKRVMRLAAVKKQTERESLSRTLSIASTDTLDRSSQSSQEVSPTTTKIKTKAQPGSEPVAKSHEIRTERIAASPPPMVVPKPVGDKRRPRAQTMQPALSSSPFRDPDSLEFRLSLYNDPDELPDFSPESPRTLRRTACYASSATKPTTCGRPKSRSVGTGWVL